MVNSPRLFTPMQIGCTHGIYLYTEKKKTLLRGPRNCLSRRVRGANGYPAGKRRRLVAGTQDWSKEK